MRSRRGEAISRDPTFDARMIAALALPVVAITPNMGEAVVLLEYGECNHPIKECAP